MSAPTSEALRWKRASPWFNVDLEKTKAAIALHQSLLDDGIDPESEEYWSTMHNFSMQVELGFPVKPMKHDRDRSAWYITSTNAMWLSAEVSRITSMAKP